MKPSWNILPDVPMAPRPSREMGQDAEQACFVSISNCSGNYPGPPTLPVKLPPKFLVVCMFAHPPPARICCTKSYEKTGYGLAATIWLPSLAFVWDDRRSIHGSSAMSQPGEDFVVDTVAEQPEPSQGRIFVPGF